ncbi:MAG: elongation factor G [bacterium]
MKPFPPNDHRNVALVGHGGSGKTSLAEALLFRAKAVPRLGSVHDGSSVLDYLPEEHRRKGSVSLAVATFEHAGKRITLVDTPGFPDFEAELVAGLNAASSVLLVVAAETGIGVGAELAWKRVRALGMPAAIVINGMDKEHAKADAALESIQAKIGKRAVAMQIPMGSGASFQGIVDVLRSQAILFKGDGAGEKGAVPGEYAEAVAQARASLMESAAEATEELMNRYFEAGELSQEDLVRGIHLGIAQGDLYPVFFASAVAGRGLSQILDGIADLLPGADDRPAAAGVHPDTGEKLTRPAREDAPLAARIFKLAHEPHVGELYYVQIVSGVLRAGSDVWNATRGEAEKTSQLFLAVGKNRKDVEALTAGDIGIAVKLRNSGTNDTICDKSAPIKLDPIPFPAPVIDFALRTKTSGEEDKMGTGLGRLQQEDPSFRYHFDDETHQAIVSGLGETHLDLAVQRLKERFNVEVELSPPRIPFRETIRGKAEVHARHKKQTGGRGQFADVHVRLEPQPEGKGFEFVDDIVGGVVPGRFVPAVEKGIREAMVRGAIAGYPLVDFKATLFDGSYHSVDSSEAAFKVAGALALRQAAQQAKPTILEPYVLVKIIVPQDYMGDVMGDMSSRRGKIQGMEADGDDQVIRALVPMAEMRRYAMDLRSMTQGRGRFERAFSHYEELPRELQEKVIAEAKVEQEEVA